MKSIRLGRLILWGVGLIAWGGCQHRLERVPLDPIPMTQAVAIVNRNIAGITGTLRAVGSVDGHFALPRGRRRSYHVDGVLFYHAPSHVRFDLKAFGARQFLFGSNAEHYWYYDKEADAYHCGRRGAGDRPPEIPVRPDQIVDAMALTALSIGSGPGADRDGGDPAPRSRKAAPVGPVQRVVPDYQQILFLSYDDRGRFVLQKEYWLDRYSPRLVRRVLFRDAEGVVTMESSLDDYRPLEAGGPLLPHTMIARWPQEAAEMRFRIAKWASVPQVGPDSVQFALPRECIAEERVSLERAHPPRHGL